LQLFCFMSDNSDLTMSQSASDSMFLFTGVASSPFCILT
jgi:hypothetical protein